MTLVAAILVVRNSILLLLPKHGINLMQPLSSTVRTIHKRNCGWACLWMDRTYQKVPRWCEGLRTDNRIKFQTFFP